MSNGQIADVLERAADLIEPEGCWGRLGDGITGPRFCAALAIDAAGNNKRPLVTKSRKFLAQQIGGISIFDVFEWNDAPERTQAEVVAKLRESAAKAREQSI